MFIEVADDDDVVMSTNRRYEPPSVDTLKNKFVAVASKAYNDINSITSKYMKKHGNDDGDEGIAL